MRGLPAALRAEAEWGRRRGRGGRTWTKPISQTSRDLTTPLSPPTLDSGSDAVLSSDGEMAESDEEEEVDYEDMVASKVVEKKVPSLSICPPSPSLADADGFLCVLSAVRDQLQGQERAGAQGRAGQRGGEAQEPV